MVHQHSKEEVNKWVKSEQMGQAYLTFERPDSFDPALGNKQCSSRDQGEAEVGINPTST